MLNVTFVTVCVALRPVRKTVEASVASSRRPDGTSRVAPVCMSLINNDGEQEIASRRRKKTTRFENRLEVGLVQGRRGLRNFNDGSYGRRTVPPGTPARLRARRATARFAAQRRDVIPTNVVRAVRSNPCQQWRHRLNAEPHSQRDRPYLTLPPRFGSAGRRTRPWRLARATSSRVAAQSIAVHSLVFATVPPGWSLAGVPCAVAG